ncbi:MAG: hypothetical protein AB7G06_00120 [Bdellovibrionales bacterium]
MKATLTALGVAAFANLPVAQAQHQMEILRWERIFGSAYCAPGAAGTARGPVPMHPDHGKMNGCHGTLCARPKLIVKSKGTTYPAK